MMKMDGPTRCPSSSCPSPGRHYVATETNDFPFAINVAEAGAQTDDNEATETNTNITSEFAEWEQRIEQAMDLESQ